ncbi:uncharacterized protein LOC134258618, partial [Saccostrea cucullata]
MATPKKLAKLIVKSDETPAENIQGYVHEVSPLKTSKNNNKYFNAKFQDNESFLDMVCYRSDLLEQMKELEKNRTPVMLQKIGKAISLTKPGKFDVKILKDTRIAPCKKLDFRFENPPESEVTSIADIKDHVLEYAKVTVAAKVLEVGDIDNQITSSGKSLKKRESIIADNSGAMGLTIWEEQISLVEPGKSYKFKNLTLRIWNEKKKVSTAINSSIEEVENIEAVNDHGYEDITIKKEKNQLFILSASCSKVRKCTICNSTIQNINEEVKTFKCTICNMRQNISSIHKFLECEIVGMLDGKQRRLQIPNQTLKSFSPTQTMEDSDEIEDA